MQPPNKKNFKQAHYCHLTDLEKTILDEIALEGLSGVTLNRLLKLTNAHESAKKVTLSHLWTILVGKYLRHPEGVNVEAFHTKPKAKERDKNAAELVDRKIYADKQIKLPTQTVGVHAVGSARFLFPVQEGRIMGSCDSYQYRVNITKDLLKKADKDGDTNTWKYLKTKFGADSVRFVASQHIRSRAILPAWIDPNMDIKLREYCVLEMIGKSRTKGIIFPNDKTFGRYRIMLMAKGLITQYQEVNTAPIQHHLRRFAHSNSKVELLPKRMESLDSDDEDDDSEQLPLSKVCYDPNKIKVDRAILAMVYEVVAQSPAGCTHLDIRRQLNMPKFHLRNHLKNLISLKLIYSIPPKDPESTYRLYKTTFKSVKRKKSKREELAKPVGIMAKWDEVDLRAKKIIGHKRSHFSQAEDSLLILCRITSILIEPSRKLSWCVNKRLVRDLLHRELIESHDKTSDACLRRIKYLKKLPNNIMSISELTAELRDDPHIERLIQNRDKSAESDEKLNKLFVQVLKRVRVKTPDLLGITNTLTHSRSQTNGANKNATVLRRILGQKPDWFRSSNHHEQQHDLHQHQLTEFQIKNYNELKCKYKLTDCQSIAEMTLAPTYERAKNLVDVKYNNACLMTMAYLMTSYFEQPEIMEGRRRSNQWLLDKFYSGFADNLISSVHSKLKKQTLLTRKGSASKHGSVHRARARSAVKLNQTLQFLMSRYHSNSLIHLASPLGTQLDKFELNESNQMGPFSMLASLCALSSFNLDMDLRIPDNVVGIDLGSESFGAFHSKANRDTREIIDRYLSRCGVTSGTTISALATSTTTSANSVARSALSSAPIEPSTPSTSASTATTTCSESGKRAGEQDVAAPSERLEEQREPVFATLEPVRHCPMEVDGNNHEDDGDNNAGGGQAITMRPTASATIATTKSVLSKMDDSRRALFMLRHELKSSALDKCGNFADFLIVQPCNIRFYSSDQSRLALKSTLGAALSSFLEQAKPSDVMDTDEDHGADGDDDGGDQHQPEQPKQSKQQKREDWLVDSYRLPRATNDGELLSAATATDATTTETATETATTATATSSSSSYDDYTKHFEAIKVRVNYYARLWKWLDGSVHLPTLLKLIETFLARIITFPGVERELLYREYGHLMPDEHLFELLDLMESMELITSERIESETRKPQLFGYRQVDELEASADSGQIVYEATAGAYIRYCQFLDYCK